MITSTLTIQKHHLEYLRKVLIREDEAERKAYVLCGQAFIRSDPWSRQPHHKFISYEILEDESISYLQNHSLKTDSFFQALDLAQAKDLTVAIFCYFPKSLANFSTQDDVSEKNLLELVHERNGLKNQLLSVILTSEGKLAGRLWLNQQEYTPLSIIRIVGESIQLHYPGRGKGISAPALHRQALALGDILNQDLSMLRIGIVGCGGTGSAVAMLLPKMGVRQIALFDKDDVEDTNLNRLHGASQSDADAKRPKVEVIAQSLAALGLGIEVKPYQTWIGEPEYRDALKACDLVFGCTDDHSGRLMLNRFAYYYATPVFDMGLAIEVSQGDPPEIEVLDGRVTVLAPKHTCLLCRSIINPVKAREESLNRNNPAEYERQKAEAYVLGEGNPRPAVVIFTTNVAIMAVEELIHRLQGFRGEGGAAAQRVRKFKLMEERRQGANPNPHCPICGTSEVWGRGDITPFLDQLE